ncbi:unnamed protein product [Paramecium sonneborni]|uniref:Uncharacterized protein n=1 Tax=Paramecium sonneborni TaxID=65129 RepID=A0A8S1K712_9CILI|nr:unnamed protein product [Paramecium sonneborni]
MLTIFDDFYNNKNIPDFLDDDTILINKENNIQLKEFLLSNEDLVTEMLSFFQYDELETDHKRVIKYPFVVSELLGSLYALNVKHLNFLIQLLNSENSLPSITIGYITKVIMNVLKNNPCIFWQNIHLSQLHTLIKDINNYTIAELIYSMIIYQTQENQLEYLEQRISLVDYLINQINTDKSEGVSNVICMLLNQITETLQQQKSLIIKHLYTKLDIFLAALPHQPQSILSIFTNLIKYQQYYESEVNQIYNHFLQTQDIFQNLIQNQNHFGQNNFSYIQFYDALTNQPYVLQNINAQYFVSQLFQLIQKYQYHNQLHKYATNIIVKLIPQTDTQQLLEIAIIEFKIKPIKANRGYITQIINKIYEVNSNQEQQEQELQQINSIQNNYFFGQVPDQKPTFNLQEEFEAAMNKLQI